MNEKLENMMNEMQRDLLIEYVNVFMGQAASVLSEMANQPILISVSKIELVNMSDERGAARLPHGNIVSSSMKFGYEFSGRALSLLHVQKAKLLVDAYTRVENGSKTESPSELIDYDFDVLKEISNVILNTVVGEFSKLMGTATTFSVPNVDLVHISEKDQIIFSNNRIYMLMFHTHFMDEIEGMISIALGMNALNKLLGKIDELLGEIK